MKRGYDEKLAIFQQINSWIQHLNHILWTVTSLFGTLNVLIIWKFIKGEMTGQCVQNFIFIKISYFALIVGQFLFSISIGIITMKLANLLIDNNPTREKLAEALQFDLFSPKTKKNLELFFKALDRPWVVVSLIYINIYRTFGLFLCIYFELGRF